MLPALDSHIVLGQVDTALGDHAEAARHLAIALDGAAQHHFANVLADAVVACARLVSSASPADAARALSWAADIARLPQTSVSVRQDAVAIAGSPASNAPPRALDDLAREARAAIAALSPPRAVPARAR
jgi:hypothetical protein